MEVHYDDGVTEVQHLEVDLWVIINDLSGIDTIVVGALVVAIHGISNTLGVVGTAERHGDLVAELDEALAEMQRT